MSCAKRFVFHLLSGAFQSRVRRMKHTQAAGGHSQKCSLHPGKKGLLPCEREPPIVFPLAFSGQMKAETTPPLCFRYCDLMAKWILVQSIISSFGSTHRLMERPPNVLIAITFCLHPKQWLLSRSEGQIVLECCSYLIMMMIIITALLQLAAGSCCTLTLHRHYPKTSSRKAQLIFA